MYDYLFRIGEIKGRCFAEEVFSTRNRSEICLSRKVLFYMAENLSLRLFPYMNSSD